MMRTFVLTRAAVPLMLLLLCALPAAAQQAGPALDGSWTIKYADGSQGSMTVQKGALKFTVPGAGELAGNAELRGDYFESILGRSSGIHFIFGYLKGGGMEGKLQERAPCAEMKKAFKSGIVETGSSCQVTFTAVRK